MHVLFVGAKDKNLSFLGFFFFNISLSPVSKVKLTLHSLVPLIGTYNL
jgi:hypothetical protein